MQYRRIGKTDMNASVVGLGTWAIGGWMWGGTKKKESVKAIQTAIDLGMNLIDTAPIYGMGVSEEIVGKALKGRRKDVVLATKCGLVWDFKKGEYYFDFDDGAKIYKYLAPKAIRHEVEQSLSRLKVDVIDIYQTHWQESTTPIADTMGELMKLKEEGKIRAIGVSNATTAQMDEYRAAGPLDTDQEKYNMLDRGPESEQLPYCDKHRISFLSYSTLAKGLLSGKMSAGRRFKKGDQRKRDQRFSKDSRTQANAMLDEFIPFAKDHDITIAQLVIAWTYHRCDCIHTLVGARTPDQAVENARAGHVRLHEDVVTAMNGIIGRYADEIPNSVLSHNDD